MKNFLSAFILGGALMAAPASAGIITIDFTGGGGLQPGATMSFPGVDVTAGAQAMNGEYDIVSRIGQYSGGLGNTSSFKYDYQDRDCLRRGLFGCWQWGEWYTVTKEVNDRSHEVDDWDRHGHGVREYLMLEFDSAVTLIGATFGAHGFNDDEIVISNDDGEIYSGGEETLESDDFSAHLSDVFYFMAGGDSYNNNDWKLASVTVFVDDGPGGGEIPLPATLLLFGAGLVAMARSRRKA